MVGKAKKEARCDDVISILSKDGNAVFFTLTTPDSVDYHEIRRRWRVFRHDLLRSLRTKLPKGAKIQYVMNFEAHPGYLQKVVAKDTFEERIIRGDGNSHGWHIHGVINAFVSIKEYRPLLDSCGFGRCDFRRVTSAGVSDYLTKHALKAYRGLSKKERGKYPSSRLRLVNASRGLPALDSYVWHSPHWDGVRLMFKEWQFVKEEKGKVFSPSLKFGEIKTALLRCECLRLMGYRHLWDWQKLVNSFKTANYQYRKEKKSSDEKNFVISEFLPHIFD